MPHDPCGPALLTRRLTTLASSGGVHAVPAVLAARTVDSQAHRAHLLGGSACGPGVPPTRGTERGYHGSLDTVACNHSTWSRDSSRWVPQERESRTGAMGPARERGRRTRPSGHRISSSRDPYRENHSSGPISQPGEAIGPTESSHMVAFALTTSPPKTTGPTYPAPLHSATPQRISTLDKLEAPAPRVGSPTAIATDKRLGSTPPRQAKTSEMARFA